MSQSTSASSMHIQLFFFGTNLTPHTNNPILFPSPQSTLQFQLHSFNVHKTSDPLFPQLISILSNMARMTSNNSHHSIHVHPICSSNQHQLCPGKYKLHSRNKLSSTYHGLRFAPSLHSHLLTVNIQSG